MHHVAPRSSMVCVAMGLALSWASDVRAQECGCDHVLALDVTTADGEALGIAPGDVVCLEGGERPFLRLQGFQSTQASPIVVTSCGATAVVRNTDRAYALVVEGQSQHVRITGSSVDGTSYGIRVSAPDREPYAGVGVWLQGRSSDIEVDHVEVFDTGFAGVMAKTDPGCDDRAAWDGYVMRNIRLHHLWVHDTGGEGFYVGSTQAAGYERDCGGTRVTIPAHDLEGVEIHHVLIEDTGWDGAQIGFARSGCSFSDNVVRRVGGEGVELQQQGLQIGSFSSCEVRRNVISDGPAMGIIVLDAADSLFADNVIARFGADGIYANLRDGDPASYRVVHNTIASFGGSAVRIFGADVEGASAIGNFVIGGGEASIAAGGDVALEREGNVFAASMAEARVRGDDDFHLEDDSPARGAGVDRTRMGFAFDLEGRGRAMPPSAGAYEHDDDVVEEASVDAGVRAGDAGVGASSSGCGCRAGGPAPRGGALAGAAVACALAWRRRARRGE